MPWYLIPNNIFMNLRLIYAAFRSPNTQEAKAYLRTKGLTKTSNMLRQYRPDVPWISPSTTAIEFPLTVPPNVTEAGPIFILSAPLAEENPELAAWLARAPTILINLGSHIDYDEDAAVAIVGAIQPLLDAGAVQVLWKFNKRPTANFSDAFLAPVAAHVEAGALRLERWIDADIAALLATGDVAVSVHHGGANCFHETLA